MGLPLDLPRRLDDFSQRPRLLVDDACQTEHRIGRRGDRCLAAVIKAAPCIGMDGVGRRGICPAPLAQPRAADELRRPLPGGFS